MEGIEWDSEILDDIWKRIVDKTRTLHVENEGAAFWIKTVHVLSALDWAADRLKEKIEGE